MAMIIDFFGYLLAMVTATMAAIVLAVGVTAVLIGVGCLVVYLRWTGGDDDS
jgi:hypothetical protein